MNEPHTVTRNIIADLHKYDTTSDGEYSLKEMVTWAKDWNSKSLGRTDHDASEELDEAIQAWDRFGVKVITKAELNKIIERMQL